MYAIRSGTSLVFLDSVRVQHNGNDKNKKVKVIHWTRVICINITVFTVHSANYFSKFGSLHSRLCRVTQEIRCMNNLETALKTCTGGWAASVHSLGETCWLLSSSFSSCFRCPPVHEALVSDQRWWETAEPLRSVTTVTRVTCLTDHEM